MTTIPQARMLVFFTRSFIGGEGTRGGEVIGHEPGGKPIYATGRRKFLGRPRWRVSGQVGTVNRPRLPRVGNYGGGGFRTKRGF
jgi:hypothetical protein